MQEVRCPLASIPGDATVQCTQLSFCFRVIHNFSSDNFNKPTRVDNDNLSIVVGLTVIPAGDINGQVHVQCGVDEVSK